MSGIVFPNVANALLPLMQMDRQAERDRVGQERLQKHDEWMQQDRTEARDLQKMQVQQALSDKQRTQLKDAADATSQAALGVLGAPEAERPAAYQSALSFLKSRGLPIDNLPQQYSQGMDGMLRFYVQRAESAHDYLKRQGETPQPMGGMGGAAPGGAPAAGHPGDVMARAGNAIGGIESGGKYDALGPMTGGDRAYGKYQVMGANVPQWTAEVLGKPMTPQEFVANPQAQDAVFKAKFGQYVQKYGPEGASKAWFAGEGGMNNPGAKDVLGTSVADYAGKFNAGMGGPQAAQAGGVIPQGDAVSGQGDVRTPPGAADEVTTLRGYVHSKIPGAQVMGVQGKPVYDAGGRVMIRLPNGQTDTIEAPPKAAGAPSGYRPTPGGLETIPGGPADREKVPQGYRMVPGGNLEPIPGGPGAAANTKQNAEQANKLRDDFRAEPVVKSYRVVVPMLESAKDAATRPNRAADINLVYAFAKLMDPDSVVRESETGMVQASGTIADRLGGVIGQLNGNAMLRPETRAKLIAELDSRFKSLEASYNEISNAYGGIADANGVKREHVILPIRKPKTEETQAPTAGGVPEPPAGFRVIK